VTAPWWRDYAPATTTIACGDGQHRLGWRDGGIVALDHPDAEGDRTLAALGGERYPCLTTVEAWTRHRHDLRVLVLGSRGPSDPVGRVDAAMAKPTGTLVLQPGGVARRKPTFRTGRGAGWPGAPNEDELAGIAQLVGLGGGLSRRLAAGVAAHWCARLDAGDDEARRHNAELHAALFGRVAATIREWLDQPDARVELDVIDPIGNRLIEVDGDGYRLALPFAWLHEVWGRGLGAVAGRLVLAVDGEGDDLVLDAVSPDLGRHRLRLAPP
jgi:hypothetical protein